MPRQPLDYESAQKTAEPAVALSLSSTVAFIVVALIVNGLLLMFADADPGFGSMLVCLFVSPACNGVLLAVGLACLPLVAKRTTAAGWIRVYAITCIVLPLLAMAWNVCFLKNMRRY